MSFVILREFNRLILSKIESIHKENFPVLQKICSYAFQNSNYVDNRIRYRKWNLDIHLSSFYFGIGKNEIFEGENTEISLSSNYGIDKLNFADYDDTELLLMVGPNLTDEKLLRI